MELRYISAKNPDDLSNYFRRIRGVRFSIVSGPILHKGRWYVWLTAERGIFKNNLDL
jgi:hypothetical protein